MKIAFCGKGGVGKSTVTVLLGKFFLEKGYEVLAIDADPSPHLARLFGFEKEVKAISEMKELLEERAQKQGAFYTLNPYIEDLPEKFMLKKDKLSLMVLGAIREAGTGCACPEQTVLRRLMTHLILRGKEVVLIDMEAGVEHFGRNTIAPMDAILIITRAYRGSIETAKQMLNLAEQAKLRNTFVVGNAVRNEKEEKMLRETFGEKFLGALPEDRELEEMEIEGKPLFFYNGITYEKIKEIGNKLI